MLRFAKTDIVGGLVPDAAAGHKDQDTPHRGIHGPPWMSIWPRRHGTLSEGNKIRGGL
jgi:hypothetical protein